MAQSDSSRNIAVAHDYERTGQDESVSLTTTYANKLTIDMTKLRSVTIMLRNTDDAIGENYKIFTTVKRNPTSTPGTADDEWFEEVAEQTLAANAIQKQRITGEYTKLIVQAKSASGTPAMKIWYRGLN